MKSVTKMLFRGAPVLVVAWMLSSTAVSEEAGSIRLEELWEDTPVTRELPHDWRIYRRTRLPNRLHEQLPLYLVRPADVRPGEQRPSVVFVHGGGWSAGDAAQWFPQCRYFARRGVVTASIEYRLRCDEVDVEGCLADCKSAVRYLRRHAEELGIDPQRIAVVGESAGGHLAAALGTIEGFDHPEDDLSVSSSPDLLILLNPITDLSTRWGDTLGGKAIALSPLHHVSDLTPPTLLVHGDADTCVDIEHSRAFLQRMEELGRPCRLLELADAGHAFAVFKYGPDHFVQRTILEIDRYLAAQGWLPQEAGLESLPDARP